MLAGDTEHDVDDKVMNTRNEFVFKLKKLKELHVKCMGELAEYKMKHNLCVFLIIFELGTSFAYCL